MSADQSTDARGGPPHAALKVLERGEFAGASGFAGRFLGKNLMSAVTKPFPIP